MAVNAAVLWCLPDWRFYSIELLAVVLIVAVFGPQRLVKGRRAKAAGHPQARGIHVRGTPAG